MAGDTHYWRSIPAVWDVGDTLTPGMRSAARPFRVLELFDEIRRPARAGEIADRLGLPQSTASLLLRAMVDIGYLDYDPERRSFQTSLRLTLLGSWRDSGRLRAGALMTMIERLAAETGLSASLSNRTGIHLRYLQTVQHEAPGRPRVKLAARRYAVWSTGGLVLLAPLSDYEVMKLVRRTKGEDEPSVAAIDPARVWNMLATARAAGWLAATGLTTTGACAIARAVPTATTGYDESLALTLSNGTADLGRPAEAVAAAMAAAIERLTG